MGGLQGFQICNFGVFWSFLVIFGHLWRFFHFQTQITLISARSSVIPYSEYYIPCRDLVFLALLKIDPINTYFSYYRLISFSGVITEMNFCCFFYLMLLRCFFTFLCTVNLFTFYFSLNFVLSTKC